MCPHFPRCALQPLSGHRRVFVGALLGWVGAVLADVPVQAAEDQPVIDELSVAGARIEMQFDSRFDAEFRRLARGWVQASAQAVADYFGRFPLPEVEVLVLPSGEPGVHGGTAFALPQPYLRLRVGPATQSHQFDADWVLVHEMIHLAIPHLPPAQSWFHEGVATYVEGVARARARRITPQALWGGLATGLPNGLPAAGDRGLDHTPTWGRTYWGGALFCLLADVRIRQRTQGRAGLQQALAGILEAGGNYASDWPLERILRVADQAVGQTCLAELHALMKDNPATVDLASLWRELGVLPQGPNHAHLDDSAPLARLRRLIAGQDP